MLHVHQRRDAGAGHEHEHAGGVGAPLRGDIGLEGPCHEEIDNGKGDHEGAVSRRPLRRHAVARQVARHHVEEAGHRRGPGEPEDKDRGDIVDGTEDRAEERADVERALAMGDVGECPVEGLPFVGDLAGVVLLHPQLVGRDDRVGAGDERGADEEKRHDQGGGEHEPARVGDPCLFVVWVFITAADKVDQEHAGFEAGEAEGELGEDQQRDPQGHPQAVALERRLVEVVGARGDLRKPLLEEGRVAEEVPQPAGDDQERQPEEDDDEDRGDAHDLGVALEEHRPEEQEEHRRYDDLIVGPGGGAPCEDRIADEVRGGVGGGERLRDHEVGGSKADQNEDADLPLPAAHEPLDHPD